MTNGSNDENNFLVVSVKDKERSICGGFQAENVAKNFAADQASRVHDEEFVVYHRFASVKAETKVIWK